jgi:hypothetical protein
MDIKENDHVTFINSSNHIKTGVIIKTQKSFFGEKYLVETQKLLSIEKMDYWIRKSQIIKKES